MTLPTGFTGRDRMGLEQAEALAIAALGHLAEDPETLGNFLGATGLGPETLRAAASEPGFLAAVLEFLMGDESLLLVFAERQRIRPTLIAAARYTLARTIEEA